MRRMISDAMQRQIKNLFESVQTDESGNVEVGKRLTVDGDIRVKDFDDYKNTGGQKLTEFLRSQLSPRNHFITVKGQNIELNLHGVCLLNTKTTGLLDARNKVFNVTNEQIPASGYVFMNGKVCNILGITILAVDAEDVIRYVDETGTEKTTTLGTFGTTTYKDLVTKSAW
ncbi:hypothetical protein [Methanomethylophilus alvi]|uniref:hypothetical protein n=1 Tax=Methanomethylophilus alvi TaxID=1291540 RepID=UPI0037DC276A